MSAQDPPPPADAWEAALAFLPFVRRVAREFRRDPWDTDDLIQEGLLAVHDASSRFDPRRGSFFRLVDVAVQNRMLRWLQWRRRAVAPGGDLSFVLARSDRLDLVELAEVLAAIEFLSERRRTILREHFGLRGPARKAKDIGVDLGMTRETVAKNQSRALVKVREGMGVAS